MDTRETLTLRKTKIVPSTDRLSLWVKRAGYEYSSVWCRNMSELIGSITHGESVSVVRDGVSSLENAISEQDACEIVSILITQGRAELIFMADGSVTWNIYHRDKENQNISPKT